METNIIYKESCLETCKRLPDESIDCVITSPPYWNQRDYGYIEQWGLEPTPEEYLEHLWSLMDELYRVLKPEGTVWINLGDTYNGTKLGNTSNKGYKENTVIDTFKKEKVNNIKNKSLLLIPHRFAIGCMERGWIIRNDIIWAKRNGMPESVTDRFSKKHEYMFFMTKSEKYYFNLDAIKDKCSGNRWGGDKYSTANSKYKDVDTNGLNRDRSMNIYGTKNPGDVSDFWDKSKSYPNRKYFFQENYFENIDSQMKAYWLGFIWADGYLNTNALEIELHIKDIEQLQRFRDDIGSTHKIYERERPTTHSCRIVLGSQKLVSDLISLGYNNKEVPINLPVEYEKDFIRGLFDGDGSVGCYSGYKGKIRSWLELLGKEKLMLWVKEKLDSIGMYDNEVRENKGTYRLSYTESGTEKFYNYIYSGYEWCMERKKVRFPNELNYEFDLFDIPTKPSTEKHYATYNDALIYKPIMAGCPEGGIIYDPFAGTCTTAEETLKSKRLFIASEMSEEFIEIGRERLEPLLNVKPFF